MNVVVVDEGGETMNTSTPRVVSPDGWPHDGVNEPEALDAMPPLAQAALRMWVRLALEPIATVRDDDPSGLNFSYRLKHDAERALGWYVANGQLKGAMLAEGFAFKPCGTPRDPSPNWLFNCRPRCRHRMGRTVVGTVPSWRREPGARPIPIHVPWAFKCPLAARYAGYDTNYTTLGFAYAPLRYPSLCEATTYELEEFDRLRKLAARQAA
jgi:hypothetical protein